MQIRIIINTMKMGDDMSIEARRSEIWRGDLEIEPEGEYITKISIIADGFPQPICDIPFSPMEGYYQWIPPLVDNEKLEEIEEQTMTMKQIEDKEERI